ncbi:Protein CBR-HAF-3 [Caenorhabditis briggsae]|uniref:Protein CBR-HAF-3 n=1 Tax=Caenorhabditis briggsae TaxID=6238 RepID=A8WJQ6_CAEBR|nr:Protein CBR-HAF-3 [Caenorhabditis briggsae]CAP20699.1 Protein CBR-HAF-3 [Caenorhabditis briggsae]
MNSLEDLAFKKISECITNGTYDSLDYQLIPYHCDKVVSEILKSGKEWKDEIFRHLMDRNFMLSNLDFEDFELDETGLKFLRNQKILRFLDLGALQNGEDGENETFDVIRFLESSLNPECQKILLKLNIKGTKQFSNGWIQNLSRMFPLLLELSISGRQLFGNSGSLLFKNFPNLVHLDLGGTNLQNLDGIQGMKNLEWLSLKDLDFERSVDLEEIFQLENLKFLDLSASSTPHVSSITYKSFMLLQMLLNTFQLNEAILLCTTDWQNGWRLFEKYIDKIETSIQKLGISFLGVSSTIFLLTPRVLGKLIDEWDETKQDKMDQTDKSLLLARYFKENPVALVGVLMLGALAIAARIYCMHTAGQLVINDLRKTVFNSVLRQDMAFFDKNKVGEIVSRLSTDALIVGYSVSMNLSDGARALLTCLGSGGLMVYTSLAMCKVIVVVVPVIVGTFAVFGKLQRKYTLMMQEAVAGANQVATERLSSVRTVRMLVAEKKELAAYSDKINEIWLISKMEGLAKGCMFGSFQFTGYLALSSILFYGSNLISQGLLTYGELSSFCLYAVLSAGSLSAMSGFYLELMKGLGASSRLFELKDREPKIPLEGGIQKGNVQEAIRFEHVAFGYADRDPLFHNISFDVPAGKITAVVGSSGSGKSTIASLLLRLYDPTNGRILVDGVDLKDLDPSYWRRHIGTVGQEPVLFSTTIRDNIIYGSTEPEKVSEADIVSAAEQSNADEFIMRFPQKYDTKVGEHGSTLSGGQKQRIAIARALVNKPNILIMDEATSALDASSEYLVRIALNKLLANSKQTVMIIAHRLSTIKHADQIVVVDKGSVAECGSYEELIQIPDGIFRKLVEKQTFGFKDQDSY